MDTVDQPSQPSQDAPATASRWQAVQPWATLLSRLVLVGVMGYAGLSKISAPSLSVQSVAAYELFGDGLNQLIGYTLPFFEIALAVLLLVGLATRYVGAVVGLVMLVFIAGIASAWARGLTIDCGCFGTGGQVAAGDTEYGVDIARDAAFVLLAGIVMIWPRSPFALDRVLGLYPEPKAGA
ncbi:methylamine utilization protein MauE [Murinocardiopsis flavida]|uniref:Methylamine utilization protein MauE n=1 Tax=Murinocardiopsis flavida TaxID=645275 RepID=A0A2P8CNK7_9ACTN|nr:MauE/DoxX family redox-associated membrane protein [Murinocardiopsis flavida]PSK86549.1 methylamine utilization protein MauE [Murinocardiopsis flavida]